MAIVALAREAGALGDETARRLSELGSYRFVDKVQLEDGMQRHGLSQELIHRYDEKRPGFIDSLSRHRDDYFHFLKTVVYAEALKGDCIFLGRGACTLLKGLPGVLCARLISPRHIRIGRLRDKIGCDDRRAEQILAKSDRERSGYYRYFFDQEWSDPENYSLVLNTGDIDAECAAQIILGAARQIEALSNPQDVRRKLESINLSQAIIGIILYKLELPIQFLEAEVMGGVATLHGVAMSKSVIEAALAATRSVLGISEVVSEIQVIQEYSGPM